MTTTSIPGEAIATNAMWNCHWEEWSERFGGDDLNRTAPRLLPPSPRKHLPDRNVIDPNVPSASNISLQTMPLPGPKTEATTRVVAVTIPITTMPIRRAITFFTRRVWWHGCSIMTNVHCAGGRWCTRMRKFDLPVGRDGDARWTKCKEK